MIPKAGILYEGKRVGEFGRGHFVAVMDDKGKLNLIDTAVLRSPSKKADEPTFTDAGIRRCIELGESEHQWTLSSTRGDYFHGYEYIRTPNGNGEISGEFAELCDLRDMRGLTGNEDGRWFDEADKVRRVHLWREHGYSWDCGDIGVTLVHKDAEIMAWRRLEASVNDRFRNMTTPHSWLYDVDELHGIAERNGGIPPIVEMRYRHLKESDEMLNRMEKEYRELSRRHNEEMTALRAEMEAVE